MNVEKSDLAKIQIEKAIDLFLVESDYVCSLTLAGAAEEMLGNILHKSNKDNVLAELLPWYQETHNPSVTYAKLAKGANETRDELKHGHNYPDLSHQVEISQPLAAQMIIRALVNYKYALKKPSDKMIAFYHWIQENEQKVFSEWEKA